MYSYSPQPIHSDDHSEFADSDHLFLQVPAMPEQVGLVRRQVADFTRRQLWGVDDADALLLAVGEACNNAINYGQKDVLDPLLTVACSRLSSDELRVDISNQGNGFHPDLDVLSRLPEADEFATHGRGFCLITALVDSVEVLSDGVNTTVRLRKSRTVGKNL